MKYFTRIKCLLLIAISLIKNEVTSAQALEWMSNFGSTVSVFGESMIQDQEGYIYVAGYFTGIADFDPSEGVLSLESSGGNDIFVLKLSEEGSLVWAKRMGGTGDDRAKKIERDNDGNLLIGGYFSEICDFDPGLGEEAIQALGNHDAFVVKVSTNGSLLWVNTIHGGAAEESMDVAIDSEGNVYSVGYFGDITTFMVLGEEVVVASTGFQDGYIMKMNADGQAQWLETFGSTDFDQATSIFIDTNDKIFVGGYFTGTVNMEFGNSSISFESSFSSNDIFLLKITEEAEILWGISFEGDSYGDFLTDIATNDDGKLFLSGYFDGNLDANPGELVNVLSSLDDLAGFVICLDNSGSYLWSKELDGNNTVLCAGISVRSSGNMVVYGLYQNTMEIGPGLEVETLTANGAQDMFFIEYTQDGIMVELFEQGSFGSDEAKGVLRNSDDDWLLMGTFGQQMDADPDDDELLVNPGSGIGTLIQKLVECPIAEIYEVDGTLNCDAVADTYQWVNCITDEFIEGETNPSFTPEEDGLYYLYISTEFCEDYSSCEEVIVGVDDLEIPEMHQAYFNKRSQEIVVSNSLIEVVRNGESWLIFDSKGSLVSSGNQLTAGTIKVSSSEGGVFHLIIGDFSLRFVK
jgi:hypothetical protein